MPPVVGVLAVQGDFAKHLEVVDRLGVSGHEIRTPEDLATVDRLIIPGGESTTVGLLLERFGLAEALKRAAADGMPIWGTCMGMILLASDIEGSDQFRLGLLDIEVRRNAFGAQVHSFERPVAVNVLDGDLMAVFIRAPIVTRWGDAVEPLAMLDGQCVAVRQGKVIGTSFHPELTDDDRLHRWFLEL